MRKIIYVIGPLLCLTLVAWHFAVRHAHFAAGEYVYVLDDPKYDRACGDGRPVVLTIRADNGMLVNSEPVTDIELLNRMRSIYSTRCERALFVRAAPDASYANVADKIGRLHANIEFLNIGLITRPEQLKGCGPQIRNWERLSLPDCSGSDRKALPRLPQ